MQVGYRRWTSRHARLSPEIAYFLHTIPYLSLRGRKAILTAARVQTGFDGTRLQERVSADACTQFLVPSSHTSEVKTVLITPRMLLESLPYSPSDPVAAGWISLVIRHAPYMDYEDVIVERRSQLDKELRAATTVYHPVSLNYTPILSKNPVDPYHIVAPNLPYSFATNVALSSMFASTIPILERTLFIPRTSNKTIGEVAQGNGRRILELCERVEVGCRTPESTADLERVYHDTGGMRIPGPTEMRIAWKYNDLKPRVYYAQGPDQYYSSRYIQAFFNILVDQFPMTHRLLRTENPQTNILSHRVRLAIYDYSSFTSLLSEIKPFVMALAQYYEGVKLHCVDTVEGMVEVDAGDMLRAYYRDCCDFPTFDVNKVIGPLDEITRLYVHNCGMLGVPGNISSSTLLHGIHLALISQSVSTCRVIGDDALAQVELVDSYSWSDFSDRIRNIGVVGEEKEEIWDMNDDEYDEEDWERNGWHYTKRPITRLGNRIHRGQMFDWPSLANILGINDIHHTEPPLSITARQRKFLSQWKRLLVRLHVLQTTITEHSRSLLYTFQILALDNLELRSCREGIYHPHFLSDAGMVIPKRFQPEDFGKDWVSETIKVIRGTHRVPLYRGYSDKWFGCQGEEFVAEGDRCLNLMDRLGYLKKEMLFEDVVLDGHTPCAISRFYLEQTYSFSYRYTVLKDFPGWVNDMRQYIETHVPT